MSALSQRALELAIAEIGNGEIGGNNRGPHVDRYREQGRTGGVGGDGAWCAAFVSYCYRRAAAELRCSLPFETSAGAKRLIKNLGGCKAGSFIDPVLFAPNLGPVGGSLICWHRGALGALDWRGHIGFVVGYDGDTDTIVTVEGNKRPVVDRFTYPNGVWRKRVFRLAALK